jgi:outer membrane translocation and assembly module TamA
VFTDVGNVFADSTIRLDSVHWGAGGGIRYLSPVGPLRFDIGYKIHRKPYESPYAYFLTFGYAF